MVATQQHEGTAELRGQTPLTTLGVIDAVCSARKIQARIDLVNQILAAWCEQQQAEAIAIERVLRGMDRPPK